MPDQQTAEPDSTAVRVALWRALHVQIDAPPHVFEDEIGLQLAAPDKGWRDRPDMDPDRTRRFRASIVARARFIEDLLVEEMNRGVDQFVILGAGLDTFAQRRKDIASRLRVFEIDQPATQAWKQQRLKELGFGLPEFLRFVPVNFEAGTSWREQLITAGFDARKPAVVACAGVTLYLTRDAIADTLRQIANLALGTRLVMSFILPLELVEPDERAGFEAAQKGARASGTPFMSSFAPAEMLAIAREAGFKDVQHVSAADLTQHYFAQRTDGLRPGSEALLVGRT
jgi:methyltransferase (TIGR00027 family)